jgi:hypothetical protein
MNDPLTIHNFFKKIFVFIFILIPIVHRPRPPLRRRGHLHCPRRTLGQFGLTGQPLSRVAMQAQVLRRNLMLSSESKLELKFVFKI